MANYGLKLFGKKYTVKSLDKKIESYFNYCNTHKPDGEKRGNNICERKPYTMEHLNLYLDFTEHEMWVYSTHDDYKEFHRSIGKAQQKIVGDWISKTLLGYYNVQAMKFLLPYMSRYKPIITEAENIENTGLKTITVHHGEEKQIEDKKEDYIDIEIKEKKGE